MQPVESKGFSLKPNTVSGLSDQRLNFSVQTEKRAPNAISAFAKDSHKRAARLIGYGLILDTPEAWETVSHLLALRLSVGERAAILLAALHSLQPEEAQVICDLAFNGGLS